MASYPIKPSDINVDRHFYKAFGKNYTEISARWLVKLAQQHGDWRDFTKEEIDAFSKHDFHFHNLMGGLPDMELICNNGGATYSFTHRFIVMCFLSSPTCDKVVD